MRFSPPPVELPVELTWLLGAAFGPELPAAAGDPAGVAELARRFDLGPRIVARHGAARVEERLGPAAEELVRAHRRAVAVGLAGERTALELARRAAASGSDIIFLKGAALRLVAPGAPGWRPLVDLDVLLDREQGARLRQALVADGWAAAEEPGNPQHLPPILDPRGTAVDIHFRLRGVRVAAERWATAGELLAAGLCRPAGLADGAWVPRPPLLAAHLAAHAIEQHGSRPGTYPLLRTVADLVDLEAVDPLSRSEILAMVADELGADELAALFGLARALAAGRTSGGGEAEGGAEILLRHVVAGALDADYRRGLAIDHTAGRLRQARRDGELMRYIARKLKPPAESPDVEVGGSAGDPGSVRRRVLRPIHLAARFTSAAAARLRRLFRR